MARGRTAGKAGHRFASYLRHCGLAAAALLCISGLAAPGAADDGPIKATLTATVNDGYARLVFDMSEYDDASVRVANNVLIITFKRPIDVSIDRLASQIPDYVGTARRDPDGKGIRVALSQQVKVVATPAAEKYFIDLLPASWSGQPPNLPPEVIADLARRAGEADRLERKERQAVAQQRATAEPVRVHAAKQPTFTRYIFAIPPNTSVSNDRVKERLTLTFDTPIKFDLADVVASLPRAIGGIDTELRDDSALVRFNFLAKVDVRTFRDDGSYVLDVVGADNKPDEASAVAPAAPQQSAAPETTAPATVPPAAANDAAAPGAEVAATEKPDVAAPATIAAPEQPAAQPPPAAAQAVPPPLPADKPAATPKAEAQIAAPQTPPPPAPSADTAKAAPPAAPPAPPLPQRDAAAAPDKAPANDAPPPRPRAANTEGRVAAELSHQGTNLKLSFAFTTATAAAVFNRADMLWIVFDSNADIDLSALDGEASRTIRGAEFTHAPDADIVRIKLDHPRLASVDIDGPTWTVQIGDAAIDSTRALTMTRNLIGPNRSSVTIPFEAPHLVHRLDDPDAGDTLMVVTAFAPARGFINARDFVEFRMLASAEGVVVDPIADDVKVELAPDKIIVSRPMGLALSTSLQSVLRGSGLRPTMFDSQLWGFDQQAAYTERQTKLVAAAASAPDNKRLAPRLDLARFYVARDMYPEAKGVLDVALADDRTASEQGSATVLRAVAEIMMNRPDDALKDLADPSIGDQHDAPLWRALAYAKQGKWGQARDGFKGADAAVATLPVELQRVALKEEMRSAIEVGDFSTASIQLNDFQTIGVSHELEPAMAVLIGRLAEGMGRNGDALSAYRTAADSWDRRAAAQGQLRETLLRYAIGDLKRDDVISQLETLTTIWRGDETEIEALQMLARLYTTDGRYRDSFYVMRSALAAHPNSDMTRRIQQEAARTFDTLFLAGKGDTLSAIDALALFYDFRELTPIGRRGDEMIRRLADRLVGIDLLDQAAELLQYQVDNRLQGAARAQVATRLAVIYLMNRKADRALAALRATRTADLTNEVRNQRLLLEARALSDMGRHDVALEVIGNLDGREVIRLRSDIYWAGRHWRESAEQIELLYGERWKDWQPLNDIERSDILRAELGYALGEDTLGLGRFREKYAAKMAGTPDAHAFDVVSAPLGTSGTEFAAIAHAAAAVDTLDGFLRDMQARYPDASAAPPNAGPPASPDAPQAATPAPAVPPMPSIVPPARAAGRTALR
ncbi:MAG TPA: tetratricopeptide repeat protein [Xanthobacteraceae bacterium]|nr:tetratricopeptide repeat protein [Xanthobacteraceae bacterium]